MLRAVCGIAVGLRETPLWGTFAVGYNAVLLGVRLMVAVEYEGSLWGTQGVL